jgi:type 2 lantibiotic biosynthesis protein LanM
METVMQHKVRPSADRMLLENAVSVAKVQLVNSVLQTGLLPVWEYNIEHSIAYDASGLGAVERQMFQEPMLQWKSVNTDDMCPKYEIVLNSLQENVPVLEDKPVLPFDHLQELVSGFERMYHFLLKRRGEIISKGGPLEGLAGSLVRFIYRPTRIYAKVLHKSLSSQFLKHGIDWSIELDVLSRSYLLTQEQPRNWALLSSELRALERLDIPYFSADATADALRLDPGELLPQYFEEPCFERVVGHLKEMSDADLSKQVSIIRLSFQAKASSIMEHGHTRTDCLTINDRPPAQSLNPEQLIEHAERIAEEIMAQAVQGKDGSMAWVGLALSPLNERFQLQPLGVSLYDGTGGIALFFAALSLVKNCDRHAETASKALEYTKSMLQSVNKGRAESLLQEMGVGGATGLGSIVYVFLTVGRLLNRPDLYEDALAAARLMTPTVIATDRKYDVLNGTAGALLSLIALYRYTNSDEVLESAISCGQYLLAYCNEAFSQLPSSLHPRQRACTGFAHGAAGIAYSLLKLYVNTYDDTYLQAAQKAISYENKYYSFHAGNWRIITPHTDHQNHAIYWSTWCNGAPGIGLARLAGSEIYSNDEIQKDIEAALETTAQTGVTNIDNLCCGNMGRCEILLAASQTLCDEKLLEAAQGLAWEVIDRAEKVGHYQLLSGLPSNGLSPAFFQGMAGIGYQILRIARPQLLPSVLLWS